MNVILSCIFGKVINDYFQYYIIIQFYQDMRAEYSSKQKRNTFKNYVSTLIYVYVVNHMQVSRSCSTTKGVTLLLYLEL